MAVNEMGERLIVKTKAIKAKIDLVGKKAKELSTEHCMTIEL